jgi:hypothetical protein
VATPSGEDWTSWPSKEAAKNRWKNIENKKYLLGNEFSMMTKDFVTMLSQVGGKLKASFRFG